VKSSTVRQAGILAVAATVVMVVTTAAWAGSLAGRADRAPTQAQLARLSVYDQHIDYFTSLGYGASGARISGSYVRALALAESGGDPGARSHKGARGLTQIMPETGRKAALELSASGVNYRYVDESKLRDFKPEYLDEPAVNLLICAYLSAIYAESYGGRTDLVAAAWNAGTHSVDRYGQRPPPYYETRQLLSRVHGYMTYFQGGQVPKWPMRTWDAYGFEAPGWGLSGNGDVAAPAWKFPPRGSYRR
jgi:soluble lytic murein transglycosylase-like protein